MGDRVDQLGAGDVATIEAAIGGLAEEFSQTHPDEPKAFYVGFNHGTANGPERVYLSVSTIIEALAALKEGRREPYEDLQRRFGNIDFLVDVVLPVAAAHGPSRESVEALMSRIAPGSASLRSAVQRFAPTAADVLAVAGDGDSPHRRPARYHPGGAGMAGEVRNFGASDASTIRTFGLPVSESLPSIARRLERGYPRIPIAFSNGPFFGGGSSVPRTDEPQPLVTPWFNTNLLSTASRYVDLGNFVVELQERNVGVLVRWWSKDLRDPYDIPVGNWPVVRVAGKEVTLRPNATSSNAEAFVELWSNQVAEVIAPDGAVHTFLLRPRNRLFPGLSAVRLPHGSEIVVKREDDGRGEKLGVLHIGLLARNIIVRALKYDAPEEELPFAVAKIRDDDQVGALFISAGHHFDASSVKDRPILLLVSEVVDGVPYDTTLKVYSSGEVSLLEISSMGEVLRDPRRAEAYRSVEERKRGFLRGLPRYRDDERPIGVVWEEYAMRVRLREVVKDLFGMVQNEEMSGTAGIFIDRERNRWMITVEDGNVFGKNMEDD